MLTRIREAFDRWAVVWWPARASTAALEARYRELVTALRRGDLASLMDIETVARELDRRGVRPSRE